MPQLFVRSLKLSQFRSHKRSKLEIDERPVVLFGANGSGKTNVLEALSLLTPGRGLRRAVSDDIGRRPENLGWTVSAALVAEGLDVDIKLQGRPGSSRQTWIDGKTSSQIALGNISRVLWLVPSMDRLWIEAAEGRRRYLDRIALSFFPEHAEISIGYEKAMRERNRLLKDQVRDSHWYIALENQMALHATQIMSVRRQTIALLKKTQDAADSAFPVANLDLEHLEGDLPNDPKSLADLWAEERPLDLRAGRTRKGPHRVDLVAEYQAKGMPAARCSTGEQKALLISLVLANARALIQTYSVTPIVLLDEVAAHLDLDRRHELYREILGLKVQAWMTGTEPALFDGLGQEVQYHMVTEKDGISDLSTYKI